MMVSYLPVKFEFDWTNRFRVRVQKLKMWTDRQTDVGNINLIGGLVTHNPPKNDIFHVFYLSLHMSRIKRSRSEELARLCMHIARYFSIGFLSSSTEL